MNEEQRDATRFGVERRVVDGPAFVGDCSSMRAAGRNPSDFMLGKRPGRPSCGSIVPSADRAAVVVAQEIDAADRCVRIPRDRIEYPAEGLEVPVNRGFVVIRRAVFQRAAEIRTELVDPHHDAMARARAARNDGSR
ncbi:MAG: hypothetical protein M3N49_14765, partial [Candidatus Eremiobacteraeota bacterium]|nr:hypothetical protein [Candidatus Eremiobacteraeota bacterium]